MKMKLLGLLALTGLSLGLAAAPANAHGGHRSSSVNLGPAYVYYGNGYRRVDYDYRYRPGKRYGYFTARHRNYRDRDLWHHCFDGRWYSYNDRRHLRFHERLRYQQRNQFKRRYRNW